MDPPVLSLPAALSTQQALVVPAVLLDLGGLYRAFLKSLVPQGWMQNDGGIAVVVDDDSGGGRHRHHRWGMVIMMMVAVVVGGGGHDDGGG